jgi:hypothetical protein
MQGDTPIDPGEQIIFRSFADMVNQKSLDNLRTFDKMSKEKREEIWSRAGKKSAESRRQKKQEQEIITALTKYGTSFKVFLELSEKSPKELEKAIKDSIKNEKRSKKKNHSKKATK